MFYEEEGSSALINCFAFLMGQLYLRVQRFEEAVVLLEDSRIGAI